MSDDVDDVTDDDHDDDDVSCSAILTELSLTSLVVAASLVHSTFHTHAIHYVDSTRPP